MRSLLCEERSVQCSDHLVSTPSEPHCLGLGIMTIGGDIRAEMPAASGNGLRFVESRALRGSDSADSEELRTELSNCPSTS
jgi:hypothetical protein